MKRNKNVINNVNSKLKLEYKLGNTMSTKESRERIPGKYFCISKIILNMISFDINDCQKIQIKIQFCSIFSMSDYLNGIIEGVSFKNDTGNSINHTLL